MKRLTERNMRMKLAKAGLELIKKWIDGRLYHVRISRLISVWNSNIASFKSLKELNEWFDERFKDKETMLNWIDKTDINEDAVWRIQRKTDASESKIIEKMKMLKKVIVSDIGVFPFGMYATWSYEDRLILVIVPNYSPDLIRKCLQKVGIDKWFDEVITL